MAYAPGYDPKARPRLDIFAEARKLRDFILKPSLERQEREQQAQRPIAPPAAAEQGPPEPTDEQIVQERLRSEGMLEPSPAPETTPATPPQPVQRPATPAPRREAQPGELDMAMERPAPEADQMGPPEPQRPRGNPLMDRLGKIASDEQAATQRVKDNPYGETRRDKWARALSIMGGALTDAAGRTSGAAGAAADRFSTDTRISRVQEEFDRLRSAVQLEMQLENMGLTNESLRMSMDNERDRNDPNSPINQYLQQQILSRLPEEQRAAFAEIQPYLTVNTAKDLGLTTDQQLAQLKAQLEIANEMNESVYAANDERRAQAEERRDQETHNAAMDKAEQERQQTAQEQTNQAESDIQTADVVMNQVARAVPLVQQGGGGRSYAFYEMLPDMFTPDDHRNLRGIVGTIKSNVAVQNLLETKRQGGTFGALNQTEFEALRSALGSLDLAQSDGEILHNLQTIYQLFEKSKGEAQARLGGSSGNGGIKFLGFEE